MAFAVSPSGTQYKLVASEIGNSVRGWYKMPSCGFCAMGTWTFTDWPSLERCYKSNQWCVALVFEETTVFGSSSWGQNPYSNRNSPTAALGLSWKATYECSEQSEGARMLCPQRIWVCAPGSWMGYPWHENMWACKACATDSGAPWGGGGFHVCRTLKNTAVSCWYIDPWISTLVISMMLPLCYIRLNCPFTHPSFLYGRILVWVCPSVRS